MRQALSDFSDYVQKQQAQRQPPTIGASATPKKDSKDSKATASTPAPITEHAELDILDSLGLSDETPHVRLKQLYIDQDPETSEKSVSQLTKVLEARLDEGHGEALIDLGMEDNGDSMGFDVEQWKVAYERLLACAKTCKAECRLLMSRNTGGEQDTEVEATAKDKSCSGKVVVRRVPESVDEVIETRIAVVGNGRLRRAQVRGGSG